MEKVTITPNEFVELSKTVWRDSFQAFVRDILLLPQDMENQPFHNELDDDIQNNVPDTTGKSYSVITMPRDSGKAQSLTSKILTPTGWMTIGSIKEGDEVIGSDGNPTTVTHLHPISKMRLYEIETYDGRKTLCNGEHLWAVHTPSNKRDDRLYVASLDSLKKNYFTERYDKRTKKHSREYRHSIPTTVVHFKEKQLPLDPYTLGAWLGDGTSESGGFTSNDPEILSYFPYEVTKNKSKYGYHVLGIRKLLTSLGVRGDKHIPEQYLFSSFEQRLALLRGLLDTDGYVSKDGNMAYFYNSKKRLIDDVTHLVRSLGGRAKLAEKYTRCNGKTFQTWSVSIKIHENPFKLSRKADLWKNTGSKGNWTRNAIVDIRDAGLAEARCITVAAQDGLYITDDFLLTHNSSHLSIYYPLWRIAKDHNVRILSISRTATIAESFLSQVVSTIERNMRYASFARATDPTDFGVVPRLKKGRKQTEDWTGQSITIERENLHLKDPTIAATGLFGQILSRRADVIVCDDVVDQQNSATELQRNKVVDWLETTVIPTLVPGGVFIYCGNTWHPDDVVSRYFRDPRFLVQKRNRAIIQEATRKDLWDEWLRIRTNITIEPKLRLRMANAFYEEHRAEMDEGWETLWPSRYPYSELLLERYLNPYVFARMRQCDPSERPNQLFKEEWIQRALEKGKGLRLQDQPHPNNDLITSAGGLDLAIGLEEWNDDTSLCYMDVVKWSRTEGVQDGDFIIRQIHRGHFTPQEQRQAARTAYIDHKLASIRVESNAYQESLAIDLKQSSVNVTSFHTGKNKYDPDSGIAALANEMEKGNVVIPSDPTDARTYELSTQLANEMRAYTGDKTEHTGDGLMSAWFAYSECQTLLGDRIYFGSTRDEIKDSPNVADPAIRIPLEQTAEKKLRAEDEHKRSEYNRLMAMRAREFGGF